MSGERLRVAVAGAGGMGREALAWLRDARPDVDPVAFFVADASERPTGADRDLPRTSSHAELAQLKVAAVVLGVGDCGRRRAVAEEVVASGVAILTVVHPTAVVGPGVKLDDGCIVGPGVILTRDITVGRGVIVNYGAKAGHDCQLGAFVFIAPGAVLTGEVRVEDGATVGAGAVVLPGRCIGAGARVGAGAVITSDVDAGATVVGVPARVRHV